MPAGYFCISAVSTYQSGGDFQEFGVDQFVDLDLVPHEASTVRAALTELGLVELFGTSNGELTHDELYLQLERWRQGYDPESSPDNDVTLVLYCTGHGLVNKVGGWRLVPPKPGETPVNRWTQPAELLQAILERKDVKQVLLVLDACFAQVGASEALISALEAAVPLGSSTGLWVVAAARRLDEAQQMKFVPAFVDALHQQAERNLGTPYLDPSKVTDVTAAALRREGAKQVPWVATGYQAGGCRALPNPRFMPVDPPSWIEPRWSARARGVTKASDPGWYFTGRGEVLRALASHLDGEDGPRAQPVLLGGGAGTGKTAILGRLLMTATVRLRRALPPVARRGYLPTGDLPFTVLDVAGLDVPSAAAELARTLGLPPLDPPGLAAALVQREEGLPLMIDHVDRAVDPGVMVDQLIRPLSAVASVRLVAAVRTGAVASFSDFRRIDLQGSGDDAVPAVEAYVRERLSYHLASQRGTASAEFATSVTTLATACSGNFSAAVVAVDSLLLSLVGHHSMKNAVSDAVQSAHRRLDGLCQETMRKSRGGSASGYVDDLVACLSAACSYSPDGWLPTALWAAVAQRLTGLPYVTEDVAACAKAALAFLEVLTAAGSTLLWRPRFGYVGRGNDPARHRVIEFVVDEARRAYHPQWTGCPRGVLAVLLGAATHEDGRFAALLDDAPLLLAVPAPLVTRALKTIQNKADGRARIATWAGVPVGGDARERAFLLRLRAARNGLAPLAASAPDIGPYASPPVIWARRIVSPQGRSPVTRLALAADADDLLVVTAHDDASLTWWDGHDGRELHAWSDPKTRTADTAVLSVATALTARGPLTAAVTADHQARRWGPDGTESPCPLPGRATLTAAHASGLIALVHGSAVTIVDVLSAGGERSWTLPDDVVCADIAGTADDPVLWLVDAGGRVWQWDLVAADQPSVVSLCPAPLLLACSREDAAAVVVDVHGKPTLPTYTCGVTRSLPTPDLRSAAVNGEWLLLGGGSHRLSGWLEIHRAATGTPGTRWPLDGVAVGLGIVGDVVVAATPEGLAAIRLPTKGHGSPGRRNEAGGTP